MDGNVVPKFIKKKDVYDDSHSAEGKFTQKELVKVGKKYEGCYADGSLCKDLSGTLGLIGSAGKVDYVEENKMLK